MTIYDFSARLSLVSFVFMLVLLFALNLGNPSDDSSVVTLLEPVGLVLSFTLFLPSFYLWVTGFKRYSDYLGSGTLRALFYASVFTIAYAVFIQLKYGSELQSRS